MTKSLKNITAAAALATVVGLAGAASADEGADGFENLDPVVISVPTVEISGGIDADAEVDPFSTDDAS